MDGWYQDWYRYRDMEREREFQILGAATLKMWGPMDVQTKEAESRLVCYNFSQFSKNFGHKFLAVVTSEINVK